MHIAAQFALSTPAVLAWLAAHWRSLAANAGSTLITSIWQGAVIVCVLEIAARLMPRISAHTGSLSGQVDSHSPSPSRSYP